MSTAEQFIKERLQVRTDNGSLRKLNINHLPVDFCSNDYLGFSGSETLKEAITATINQHYFYASGSGGSRLLSGNTAYIENTESFIADFHQAEAALIFNSGYDANIGLLSSLAQRGDTIITDELIHASLIDGARLTHAHRYSFKHNDLIDLEVKLQHAKGNIYVVAESIYSMDGDSAPLLQINNLCEQYKANLIIDEAHAIGIFGDHGRGMVQQLGLQHKIFARVVTFGKALGCHGAAVLGSNQLRQYLINFARSFIYTTAAPIHNIVSIKCAYEQLMATDHTILINHKIKTYADLLKKGTLPGKRLSATGSTIQTIRFHGNEQARNAAASLQSKGFDVRAILSPTVPAGEERLRICLHTFNTDQEIQLLIRELSNLTTTNE